MTEGKASRHLTTLLDVRNSIPGQNTFTAFDLAFLWLRLRQQGLDRWIFCSGEVTDFERFRELLLSPGIWSYAGFSLTTGEPCALALLDRMRGKTVELHYTFFRNREALLHKELYAQAFFDLVFENKTVDCILMLTPAAFRHSNAFALAVGAEPVGIIPSAIPVKNFRTGTVEHGEDKLYRLISPYYQKQSSTRRKW